VVHDVLDPGPPTTPLDRVRFAAPAPVGALAASTQIWSAASTADPAADLLFRRLGMQAIDRLIRTVFVASPLAPTSSIARWALTCRQLPERGTPRVHADRTARAGGAKMPAEHLRALIQELHPGATVRQLTLAAGLDANRIAYYLKPSTTVDRMPESPVLKEISRALHCDPVMVVEAFPRPPGPH
jgi:hypothetical protein